MDCDQTEIATNYDRARALAPDTARLWLNLLSTYIDQSSMRVIDAASRVCCSAKRTGQVGS